jgi:uncharacterized membrane protein
MTDLGEKEKAQILLNEYTSLRSEINARISNAFQVIAVAAGAFAVCLQVHMNTITQLIAISIIIFPTAILLWTIYHNFFNAVLRVQKLEREVNRRAEEKLLVWENELGGLAIPDRWLNILVKLFRLTR